MITNNGIIKLPKQPTEIELKPIKRTIANINIKIEDFGDMLQRKCDKGQSQVSKEDIETRVKQLINEIASAEDAKSPTSEIFGHGTTKAEESLFLLKSAISKSKSDEGNHESLITIIEKALISASKDNTSSYFNDTEVKEKAAVTQARHNLRNIPSDKKWEWYPEIQDSNLAKVEAVPSLNGNAATSSNTSIVKDANGKEYTKIADTVQDGNCGLQACSRAFGIEKELSEIRQEMVKLSEGYFGLQSQKEQSSPNRDQTIKAYKTVFGDNIDYFKQFMLKSIETKLNLTGNNAPKLDAKERLNSLKTRLTEIAEFEQLAEDDCKKLLNHDLGIETQDMLREKVENKNLEAFYKFNNIKKDNFVAEDFIIMQNAYASAATTNGNWLNFNEIKMLALFNGYVFNSASLGENPVDDSQTILKFESLSSPGKYKYIASNTAPKSTQNINDFHGSHWVAVEPRS